MSCMAPCRGFSSLAEPVCAGDTGTSDLSQVEATIGQGAAAGRDSFQKGAVPPSQTAAGAAQALF